MLWLFSHLVQHAIFLHIPVHDQLKPDIKNDEAYDAFDSEDHHEYMSFGMAIVIFILIKCDLTKAVIYNIIFQTLITRVLFHVEIRERVKPEKRKPPAGGIKIALERLQLKSIFINNVL